MKTKGIYFLYRVLQALALPVLLFYFIIRCVRTRGYSQSLPQRFGYLPHSYKQTSVGAIWLHAVSVGEVQSCVELLRQLRRTFPRTRLFVSTSTLAGRAVAGQKLLGIADGIFYAPLDYVFAVRAVLRTLRPAVVLIAETEIWPNLFRETRRISAALAIVNGRISDRAYPRYLPYRWFFQEVLPAVEMIQAQSETMRERFTALGAPPERVHVGGNFKYDFEPQPVDLRVGSRRTWIAASTMPPADTGDVDEDDVVIAAHRELLAIYPDLCLVLAPRKPERFDVASQKLAAAGVSFLKRTEQDAALPQDIQVLLLNTIGELSGVFGIADVVFMGGTLARRGGHNILEPALFGKPVIVGPHMENFQAIVDEFRAAGACVDIPDAASLAGAAAHLLESPEAARAIGQKALLCAEAQRGASARAVEAVRALYRIPIYRPLQPWFAVAWVLAALWRWGARRGAVAALRAQRRLDVPVASIGNLTMGGTGKTPCVLHLTAALKQRGRKPGILTRGYGRRSLESSLAIPPGAKVSAERTGDEPQIFVRSGLAPVGIGPKRWEVGALLHREFGVDLLLLDDGFQHFRLARDLDIVLIDALDPFGGGEAFPLGRLREPLEGLARANIILITRSDLTDAAPAIERSVRQWNATAPIFRATVEPHELVEHGTGRQIAIADRPFRRPGAFCGLGNPESFRRTLESLGVILAGWQEFHDHHRYRPGELRRLSQQMKAIGADALVTTEKDTINLCESCDDLLAPLSLYWLKVGMTIEREDEFLAEVTKRLG